MINGAFVRLFDRKLRFYDCLNMAKLPIIWGLCTKMHFRALM